MQLPYSPQESALLLAAAIASLLGTYAYRRFALRHSVIAEINFRSLHARTVPRGGGVVFAIVFLIATLAAWRLGWMPTWLVLVVGIGGASAGCVGFVDDLRGIPAARKLAAQVALAAWGGAVVLGFLDLPGFRQLALPLQVACFALGLFVSVWFMNMYNFIDGADGMAIGGAVYICVAAIVVLGFRGGERELGYAFALLAACCLGFLPFNLPPASIFMGDAGSIFLGYCLGGLLFISLLRDQLSAWSCIAILGYYIGDTTTTGLYRLMFVKRWYGAHRSHAYQNLARVLGSHAKITYGIALYNVFWALPLAIWSAVVPGMGPVAAALALVPAVLWTMRFGPRFSRD